MSNRKGELHGQKVPGQQYLYFNGPNNFVIVRYQVPRELRAIVGKSELIRGLGTNNVKQAIAGSYNVIGEFQDRIASARGSRAVVPVRGWGLGPFRSEAEIIAAIEGKSVSAMAQAIGVAPAPEIKLAGYTWEAAIEQWALDTGSRDQSIAVYRGHLSDLFEQQGIVSGLMGDVTTDHLVAHKTALQKARKADGSPQFKNKTINNRLASIRAVFRIAKSNNKITVDPTLNDGQPIIRKLKVAEIEREGFSREQYPTIIAAALESDNPVIRWHWLIGATLGLRIGELADAKVSAVQEIDGYPAIVIDPKFRNTGKDGKGLPLKTEGSKRPLPLHSVALNAEFLAYVETIRAEHGPNAPLFPMLRPNRYGYRSDEASLICNKWLREVVGIEDRNLVFHSLRHSVKTFLGGHVEDRVHNAITGHDDGQVSSKYGKTEMAVMSAAIEKYIPVKRKP